MVTKLVGTLLAKKQVLVPMALVCAFLSVCDTCEIVAFGGGFTSDMEYQYFYTE